MISDELTQKQRELQGVERERLNLERELLELRPLKTQLESFSENNKVQIETNVRSEHEKNKLTRQVVELNNEIDRHRADNEEMQNANFTLTEQNTILVEQIKNFEK